MVEEVEIALRNFVDLYQDRLPVDFLNDTKSLVSHREYGIALENLCVQLFELDIVPSTEESLEIQRLSALLGLGSQTWSFLIEPQ
jgi:hypothetical protein